MSPEEIHLPVVIERKQADLPRYAVVPSAVLASWQLSGTTTIELAINDVAVGRRTVKKWDEDRWFLSITEADCRQLGVDTGASIRLTLRLASEELPEELAELLRAEPAATRAWERLTPAQQRMLREEIAAAKQPATRARRARKALLG